jgi:hypothetical protein
MTGARVLRKKQEYKEFRESEAILVYKNFWDLMGARS